MKNNQADKNNIHNLNANSSSVFYEVKIQGHLDPQRAKWFEGMTLTHIENGESGLTCTLISGPVIDQPALHGLLTKIRDLNLTLVSVRRYISKTGTVEEVYIKPEPPSDLDGVDK